MKEFIRCQQGRVIKDDEVVSVSNQLSDLTWVVCWKHVLVRTLRLKSLIGRWNQGRAVRTFNSRRDPLMVSFEARRTIVPETMFSPGDWCVSAILVTPWISVSVAAAQLATTAVTVIL